MNLFVVVLQELIENLKKEYGEEETVHMIKYVIKQSGLDIQVTSSGVIKSNKNITNEDNYLYVFSHLRNYLNQKIGINKTKELFVKSAKKVVNIV